MYLVNATQPSHGSLTFDNNYVYYTPATDYIDVDSFTYCVSDFNDTACASVNITVMNDAPVAVTDQYKIPKNTPTVFTVMKNDYDPNNDTITISEVTPAAYGAVTVTGDNLQVYYTPVMTSETYSDSFSYGITDGILFGFAYVTVDVGNTPPTAGDITVTIHKNSNATAISLPMADVNSLDVLTITIPKPAAIGSYQLVNTPSVSKVNIDGDNYSKVTNNYKLLYTPLPGLSGVYSEVITYAVFDGTDTTTGTVTISVINDAPTAVADTIAVHKNKPVTYDIVANDFDVNGDEVKLTATAPVATSQGGSYVVQADGKSITYTPKAGFLGSDTATYTITDIQAKAADQLTSTGSLTFVVTNDPPVAQDDTYTVSKGHSKLMQVLVNDSDPNGDAVSISDAGAPNSNAQLSVVTVAGVQYINYTSFNRVYSESWKYTAADVDGATAQALVTISVYNEAPVANPDTGRTAWNRSVIIDVLANDSDNNPGDADLFVTELQSATTTQGGSVVVVAGRAVKYTPANGFTGTDSFQYRVSDQIDFSAYTTVTVEVYDDAPIANPTTVSLHWGSTVNINVLGIDGNRDPNGDPIAVTSVSPATNGVVNLANGIATYVPNTNYVGADSFTYVLSDYKLTATATVTISITNAAPVANPVTITTHWNASTVTGYVVSACTDADSDPLTIKSPLALPTPFKGAMVIASGSQNVKYTPAAWKGAQTVGYTVTDGPATASSTIQVTVTNANVPTASDLTFTKHWTTQKVTGTTFAVLDQVGQKDADGDALSFTTTAATKGGSITNDGASITYKHSNFLDSETFTYTVSDGLDTATGNVQFTIFNNAPTAADFSVSYKWRDIAAGKAIDAKVACNAADADAAFGDVPSVAAHTVLGTPIGTVSRSNDVITFTPTKSKKGTQDISVQFTDGLSTVDATMHITVLNNLPVATPVAKSVHWRTQSTGTAWNLVALNEITDADGDSVSVVAVGSATHGTVALEGSNVRFTQTASYLGAASFVVTFTDGWENNTATWSVQVFNNKPVPQAQSFSVLWSTYSVGTLMNVAASTTDADNDPITLVSAGSTSNGGSVVVSNGQVLYKPAQGYTGTETFTFTVSDGLETANQTVTVTVTDTAPVAVADTASMHWRDFTKTVDVLANDFDAENDAISINSLVDSNSGKFSVVSGQVKLTMPSTLPVTFSTGPVAGSYNAKDGAKTGNTAPITVTITNANTPAASSFPVSFHWRTTQAGANIPLPDFQTTVDADGDTLDMSLVGSPAFVATAGSSVVYTRPSFVGTDSFQYKISDGMDSATGTISLTSTNAAPTANDIPAQFVSKAAFNNGMDIKVLTLGGASDTDSADLPHLALTDVTSLNTYTSATVQVKDSSTVFFKPVIGDFNNTDYFSYTVSDGKATVTKKCYVYTTVAAPGDSNSYFSLHWKTYVSGTNLPVLTDAFGTDGANYKLLTPLLSQPAAGNAATVNNVGSTNNTLKYQQSSTFLGDDTMQLDVLTDVSTHVKINLLVNVYDQPPVPTAKTVSTHWKTAITTNVLSGATDPDSADSVSLQSFTAASRGTTANGGVGLVTYTPSSTIGAATYSFTVTDGLKTASQTVTVTVTNTPPVATAKSYSIPWRTFRAGTNYNVMINCTDANSDSLTLTSVSGTLPTGVTTTANSPSAGFVALKGPTASPYFGQSFSFTYTITDGASNGQVSASVTANVYNTLPVTTPKTNTIHWRDTAVVKDVLTGCTDADSDPLTLSGASSSQQATVTVSGNNAIYTPASGFTGVDTVTYTVSDGVQSATGTYTVTVNNAKPVAQAYTISSSWKDLKNGYIFNVGGESTDSDANDRPFLALSGSLPTVTGATLAKLNSTHIKVTPNTGFIGTISFQYSITDGLAISDPATISVSVLDNAPYATPSATDIHWRTTSVNIPLSSKLIDADGDTISIISVTSDSGLATVTASGLTVTYTQKAIGNSGADTFTVTFSDGWAQPASTAQFTVNINDATPVAQPIAVNLHSSLWATGAVVNIINNANTGLRPTDADSADATFLAVTGVSGTFVGTATIDATSKIVTYKPPQKTLTQASITYTVSDGLKSTSQVLSVNVYNNPPSNTDYPVTMKWTECVAGVSINVKQNAADADPQDATLTYSTPTSTKATITQGTNGILTYKCNSNAVFTETLSFTTTDSGGLFTTNNILVSVTASTPIAKPDTYLQHWKLASFAANVLANDTDPDGNALSIVGLTPTTTQAGASLSIVSGKVQYTLSQVTAAKLGVADTFSYQASNGVASSSATQVSVTIYDNAPVAQAVTSAIKWNGATSFSLLSKCSDVDGETLTFSGITSPVAGTLTVTNAAQGAYTYTAPTGTSATTTYSTPYAMTYTCSDGLLTGSGTVTVTVSNTVPTITGNSASINRNYANPTFTGLTGVRPYNTDADGDVVSVSAVTASDSSLVVSTTSNSNTFSVTVPKLFVGTKSFTWQLYDGQLSSPPATYSLTFVNRVPVCQAYSVTAYKSVALTTTVACTDADGDPITYTYSNAGVTLGTLSGTAPSIVFTPTATRSGVTVYTYTGTDATTAATSNTVTVTVPNRKPTAPSQVYNLEGSHSNNWVYTLDYITDAKPTDADIGDTVTVLSAGLPTDSCNANGVGTVGVSNGKVVWTRSLSSWVGNCNITVTVTDNDQDSPATATAQIAIYVDLSSPYPPTALDDEYSTPQATVNFQIPVTGTLTSNGVTINGVMTNDRAPLGTSIAFVKIICDTGYCKKKPVYDSQTGLINYPVDNTNCVQDKFQYQIKNTDALAQTAIATVVIKFTNCYCSSALDIFFVIDSSGSIGGDNFEVQRNFLVNLTKSLNIASDKVKVGVAQFGYSSILILTNFIDMTERFTDHYLETEMTSFPP